MNTIAIIYLSINAILWTLGMVKQLLVIKKYGTRYTVTLSVTNRTGANLQRTSTTTSPLIHAITFTGKALDVGLAILCIYVLTH